MTTTTKKKPYPRCLSIVLSFILTKSFEEKKKKKSFIISRKLGLSLVLSVRETTESLDMSFRRNNSVFRCLLKKVQVFHRSLSFSADFEENPWRCLDAGTTRWTFSRICLTIRFPTQDVFPPSLSLRNPSLSKRRKVFREWQPQSFVTPFLLWFGQWTKSRKGVFRF